MTRPRARSPFADLLDCERVILDLAAIGLTNSEIASRTGTEPRTVSRYLLTARERVGVKSERALIAWYWRRLASAVERRMAS